MRAALAGNTAKNTVTQNTKRDRNRQTDTGSGTEEFMYPALYVGAKLEEAGYTVRMHATTRSPIAVSKEEKYPLHTRYELASL